MKKSIILKILFFVLLSFWVSSQSVVTTVHNLSTSGPGPITAVDETEVCIFCHTPHNSKPNSPLWNREDPGLTYTSYNSSTLDASVGQPDGSAILCLSCHDGTIALGNILSSPTDISFNSGITTMPTGSSNLTTDLSNDHPISFIYNSSVAAADGQLKDPASISLPVKLENEKVQCVSCHDPHVDVISNFLLVTTQYSQLCLSCHERDYWVSSSHESSVANWNGSGIDPWPNSEYNTVAENACESCHGAHSNGGSHRLMHYAIEEDNCLQCHNGNVSSTNIQSQLSKPYSHNVYGYLDVHNPTEEATALTQHVECQDCHNPHAAKNATAAAPDANGFLEGVRGVNQSGNPIYPVQFEYELCYRCHANSPEKPASPTSRQIEQNNVLLEFDQGNPSFHPVTSQGVNGNVPSLISPLTPSSIIYCTECHASNGTSSPAGPHGSIYRSLLKYQYETADYTTESATNYQLCYSCHDRQSILNDDSFKEHDKHIRKEDTPCNACHDPHGISSGQGNSINNSNLINFDINIVKPYNGQLWFEDTGLFSGRCNLECHGEKHDPFDYN